MRNTNWKRTILSVITCLAVLVTLLPAPAQAADDITVTTRYRSTSGGNCGAEEGGANVVWTLTDDGTLLITGTGEMADYTGTGTPWNDCRSAVTQVVIDSGITYIGAYAFSNCQNISNVAIPETVTALGQSVFYYCSGLTSVELPDGLVELPNYLFNSCTGLESVVIPGSVVSIKSGAFNGCNGLKTVYFTGNREEWNAISLDSLNNHWLTDAKILFSEPAPTEVVLSDTEITLDLNKAYWLKATVLPEDAGDKTAVWTSDAPDIATVSYGYVDPVAPGTAVITATTADGLHTAACTVTVTNIVDSGECGLMPDTVYWSLNTDGELTITGEGEMLAINYTPDNGPWYDEHRKNIRSVTIEPGVTCVGDFAFYDCSNMTSVRISDSVSSIHYYAFYGCTALETVYFYGTQEEWLAIHVGSSNDPLLNATVIFGETNAIASGYCGGEGDGSNLTWTLTADGTLTISGTGAMYSYHSLDTPPWRNTPFYHLVIEEGVTSIGSYAFRSCVDLNDAKIADSVTSIEECAFQNCSGLTSIDLPENLTVINWYTFGGCVNLTDIVLPESLLQIDSYAFISCSSLANIEIPDQVASIGRDAFNACTSLVSIRIPDGVKTIEIYTFSGCTNLVSIVLPESLERIYESSFDCYNLKNVCYAGTEAQWMGLVGTIVNPLRDATVHYLCQNAHTITYHANGAAGQVSPATGLPIGAIHTVAGQGDLVLDGYEFAGWNTAADGSGDSYAVGDTLTVTGNITLYAKWETVQAGDDRNNDGYHDGDVAVINAIIQNNGLNWTYDDPAGWPEGNDEYANLVAGHNGVQWNGESVKRITLLNVSSVYEELTGELFVSGLAELTTLVCGSTDITGLDVSGLTKLTKLSFRSTEVTEIDLSSLVNLSVLDCSYSPLAELDLSGLAALTELDCSNTGITELEVSGLTNLTKLRCGDTAITALDLSGLTALTNLNCSNTGITELDVSDLISLTSFACMNIGITELDLSDLTALKSLQCDNTGITELDIAHLTGMTSLYCSNTGIAVLDVSKLTELQTLNCSNTNVAALDLAALTKLTTLKCSNTKLTELDVSHQLKMKVLECDAAPLVTFTVPAGYKVGRTTTTFNDPLTYALPEPIKEGHVFIGWFTAPADGTLVEVGDTFSEATTLYTQWETVQPDADLNGDGYHDGDVAVINAIIQNNGLNWTYDDPAGWPIADRDNSRQGVTWNNQDIRRITMLDVHRSLSSGCLDVSGLTELVILDCSSCYQITELKVSGLLNLEDLRCWNTDLTELDVSDLTRLRVFYCWGTEIADLKLPASVVEVNCGDTNITELDLTGFSALKFLFCYQTGIAELDLSALTILRGLSCSGTKITALDLSNQARLQELACDETPLLSITVPGGYTVKTEPEYNTPLTYTLPTPAREGYIFNGWFTASSGGDPVAIGDTFSEATTLYAQWTRDPAADNNEDLEELKLTLEEQDWTVGQETANTESEVKTWIEEQLDAMDLNGASYTVTMTGVQPAVAGTLSALNGTDGSFAFEVTLSKGSGETYAEVTVTITTGVITATVYVPVNYTVTYDANGGSGTVPAAVTQIEGTVITIAEQGGLQNSGYEFVGWNTKANGTGIAYQSGSLMTIKATTTLYAQWRVNDRTVSGTITGHTGIVYTSVSAKLVSTDGVVYPGTVGAGVSDGNKTEYPYSVNAPAGKYDLVVVAVTDKGVEVTRTHTVNMKDGDATQHVNLPNGQAKAKSSVVVEQDAPQILADGLDGIVDEAIAENSDVVEVDVRLVVETVDETAPAAEEIRNQTADEDLEFVEITIRKETTMRSGEVENETLADLNNMVSLVIPFDCKGKTDIKVHRYHGDRVYTLTTEPNADGEWIELGGDHIVIHANKFSTYAIGYNDSSDVEVVLTYDANGASGAVPAAVTAVVGSEIIIAEPGDLAMNGYFFSGWNTAPDGSGTVWQSGDTIFVTEDITLYAQWTEKLNGLVMGENGVWWYYEDGQIQYNYTGLCEHLGVWFYVQNGVLNAGYTGLCEYNGIWFYVRGGVLDAAYTGLCEYHGNWFYVQNGVLNFGYTGLCEYNGVWFYVHGGVLDATYTGLCEYNCVWFCVRGGVLDFGYTGLCEYNGVWFFVRNGVLDAAYTGLCEYYGGWFYVQNGVLNFGYTGLCEYNGVWFYVRGGVLNAAYTGLCEYNGGWFYVSNGVLDVSYAGLVEYCGGWFYVAGGVLNWSYTGLVPYYGAWYYVAGGILDWNYSGPAYTPDGTMYTVICGVAYP